jgi:hypothetical protein
MKKIWACVFFIIILLPGFSQQFGNITLENKVYVSGIESVKLCLEGYDFGQPIIKLNGDDKLKLVFDDLETESRFLKYTLIHCTYDWKISDLNQLEYLDGFMEDEITDYSYSFNTIQHYIHYELIFPNDRMNITKSGNYILFVFDDTHDNPILTRRLMIMESSPASVNGTVSDATDVNNMFTKQEVDFVVYAGNYVIRNPGLYLNATIMQNGRWDNAIIGLKYRSGKPGEYSFDYDNNENVLTGGSEFRTFDIKSLRYNGNRIVSVRFQNHTNNAYIVEDLARPFGAYETNTTLKGRCYYKNEDFSGDNTEDYVITHFALRSDFPIKEGDVYVYGELTDWQINPKAKLVFNPVSNYWEASLFLKQGYYNYQYIYVKNGSNVIDETYIEGSHWETKNDYTVLIYLRDEGTVYDKLIAVNYLSISK